MIIEEIKAMRLETFLNRAYYLDRRIKRPSKEEYFILTRAEKAGNSQKELKTLKDLIEQAIEIFFKQDITYQTQESLNILESLNVQAKSSHEVAIVIERGLEITKQFK